MTCSKVGIFVALLLGPLFIYGSAGAQSEPKGESPLSTTTEHDSGLFSNKYRFSELDFGTESGHLDMFWKARIYGEGATLQSQSSEVGGFDANFDTRYILVESLSANVSLRAKYEAGRSQSILGDLEPNSGIFIREGAVDYAPFEFVNVKAGVINQDWMDLELLTQRQSFPGASIDLHYNWITPFTTGVNAQWLIPTSQTLSSRTANREATPSFETQMAYVSWKNSTIKATQTVGHYSFQDLPSVVAWESSRVGNDFRNAFTPNVSSFMYGFNGWFTQTGLSYRMTGVFEPYAYMDMIKNKDAPEANSDGQRIGVGAHFHMSEVLISATIEQFYIESDAVPGFYNSWAYGHTNKDGFGGEVIVAFLKNKFRLRAQYYENSPIIFNNNQENAKYFYLGVETGYDKI